MPIDNYVWMHSEAKLTAEQRESLAKEFDAVRSKLGYKQAESDEHDAHEEHEDEE